MATATVTDVVTTTIFTSGTPSSTSRAPPQGGILDGANPSHYDPKNPIIMFIIQAGIVITFCRLLHYPLSKMRQPRVIAEVIGGILLGPSVMGRVPGFTNTIFPTASMPNFTLVANLGLVLFLFLVGLEVDLRFLASNWKIALSVGAGGMALPFGFGCAIAWGLYSEFRDDPKIVPISFPVYMLFIGVAMAITAFPVLCRILTELKLLSTPVGIIVLSAGVGNDVIGWVLLALCVALVNAGTGLIALWVILVCVGYTLFLIFAVRPVFLMVLKRTRSLQDGPSQSIVGLTLLIALTRRFAIKVAEKIEDLVSAIFLPLYFALSGLSTNLGLLDNGITWAYVIGVTATAFVAKVIGGSGAARLNGLVWRECFTIGALMSCKGLVELIVLNIGLQAKILSQRTFTIFVVMALVTTFATTPLTSALYPPWYQKKLEAWKRGEIDWETGRPLFDGSEETASSVVSAEKIEASQIHKLLVYVRLDTMPSLLALVSLFGGANEKMQEEMDRQHAIEGTQINMKLTARPVKQRAFEIHGVRLLPLTERDSSVMQVSEMDEYSAFDAIINTFRVFGRLNNVAVSGEVAVVPEAYFSDTLTSRALDMSSQLLLLPWGESGNMSEAFSTMPTSFQDRLATGPYSDFVQHVITNAPCNTAVFVGKGFGGEQRSEPRRLSRKLSQISMRSARNALSRGQPTKQTHHLFVPFFGSVDDQVAVRFAIRLAHDERLTVSIVHFKMSQEVSEEMDITLPARPKSHTTTRVTDASKAHEQAVSFLAAVRASLSTALSKRVNVEAVDSDDACADVVERAQREVSSSHSAGGDLIVLGRNTLPTSGSSVLGNIGGAIMVAGTEASMLVVQAVHNQG